MKIWQCTVCGYIHRGDEPPEKCPVCGVPASKFKEIDEADIPEKTPKPRKPRPAEPAQAEKGKTAPPPEPEPVVEETGLEKVKSILVKHHAHPVSVHSPNGLLPVVFLLWFGAWIFGNELLSKAAFINLIFVVLSLPIVLATGIFEWQKKYNGAMTLIFKIKITAAVLTTTSAVIGLVWYLIDPGVIHSPKAWVFILLNLVMLAAAGIAGHIGGKLVFKDL
ncbi:rubredoxin-like domain-containing protein [Desulfospira joergensenii]|uniref:rubredoxin-like domain-containing protein n=1 Tax=Desulfospira joergensenii TaxID=53329 RepID=UPI0003B44F47|nr:DUF2231 domain-containing protein [Desulfospira joergensenii]